MEVDDDSKPPGTVVRVADDGYTIHDRLLRPARVFVTRRRVQAPSTQPEETEIEWEDQSTKYSA
jgi:molecular chaperone GrpE